MTLRTPPIKGSVLALRERLSSLDSFNGQTLHQVFLDLYDRVGVVIEPPVDPPPHAQVRRNHERAGATASCSGARAVMGRPV